MSVETVLWSLAATVIGGLIVGVIVLAIEYGYFQKLKASSGRQESPTKNTDAPMQTDTAIEARDSFSPFDSYRYILVGFFGAVGGFLATWLISVPIEHSWDAGPRLILPIAVIGGIIVSIIADKYFQMERYALYLRLPQAPVFGFVGGFLGLIVVIVVLIFFIVWLISTDGGTKR